MLSAKAVSYAKKWYDWILFPERNHDRTQQRLYMVMRVSVCPFIEVQCLYSCFLIIRPVMIIDGNVRISLKQLNGQPVTFMAKLAPRFVFLDSNGRLAHLRNNRVGLCAIHSSRIYRPRYSCASHAQIRPAGGAQLLDVHQSQLEASNHRLILHRDDVIVLEVGSHLQIEAVTDKDL